MPEFRVEGTDKFGCTDIHAIMQGIYTPPTKTGTYPASTGVDWKPATAIATTVNTWSYPSGSANTWASPSAVNSLIATGMPTVNQSNKYNRNIKYRVKSGTKAVAYNYTNKKCGKTITLNENIFNKESRSNNDVMFNYILQDIFVRIFKDDVRKFDDYFPSKFHDSNDSGSMNVYLFQREFFAGDDWWLIVRKENVIISENKWA
jgi:hypothetical protein